MDCNKLINIQQEIRIIKTPKIYLIFFVISLLSFVLIGYYNHKGEAGINKDIIKAFPEIYSDIKNEKATLNFIKESDPFQYSKLGRRMLHESNNSFNDSCSLFNQNLKSNPITHNEMGFKGKNIYEQCYLKISKSKFLGEIFDYCDIRVSKKIERRIYFCIQYYTKIKEALMNKFDTLFFWYINLNQGLVIVAVFFVVISLVLLVRTKENKKNEELRELLNKKELEFQKVEFEIQRLHFFLERVEEDNIKLRQYRESISKELALSNLQMTQVYNSIEQVKALLNDIVKEADGEQRKKLKSVFKILNGEFAMEGSWERFEIHFNQINNNFLDKIREQYPALNHREVRVCAYLKLNLSSKEIAPLMGISYRGVESLRFRIRKKINLDSSISLTEYIINFR